MAEKTTKKTVYVAGQISGLDKEEYTNMFVHARAVVRTMVGGDCDIIVPMDFCVDDSWTWFRCMEECMKVLWEVDSVYFLPNYVNSKGAMCEYYVATALGKEVVMLSEKDLI